MTSHVTTPTAISTRLKKVALVAGHFVPSNLAAVHRSRLWSLHLREFGWEPIIVTTHWQYYEEKCEFELTQLLPPDLKIIRTKALPTKPVRLVGDIGARALLWHYRALVDLARAKEVDFVHVTIPSGYSAVLGRLVMQQTGIPYGIDYIDPWVFTAPGSERLFSKAWASLRLAELLEPWAVKKAALISGINRLYYAGVLERNPHLRDQAVMAEMPYGGSEKDHEYVRTHRRAAGLFAGHAGKFNLIYAGAMLPNAYDVLGRLFEGLALLRRRRPRLPQQFHLHFVGTGKSPNDPGGFNIYPHIERHGLGDCVSEHPQRFPYLEILTHLDAASGILVLGSTDPHYSPSKIFQSLMSRRPVLALLHSRSSAVPILEATNAAKVVTLTEDALPSPIELASRLEQFIYENDYCESRVRWDVLERNSARESTRILAAALDESLARNAPACPLGTHLAQPQPAQRIITASVPAAVSAAPFHRADSACCSGDARDPKSPI